MTDTTNEKVEKFLNRLEEELQKKQMTIPQFAKKLGVAKITVYSWLKGENIMNLKNYYKALEVLELEEEIS